MALLTRAVSLMISDHSQVVAYKKLKKKMKCHSFSAVKVVGRLREVTAYKMLQIRWSTVHVKLYSYIADVFPVT